MTPNEFIMLIDDSKIDLYIHSEIVKQISVEIKTLLFICAEDALDYLENKENSWPLWVLVDLNMPLMNGFDFLEKYKTMRHLQKDRCKVIMISSSLDSVDLEKAASNPEIFAFLEKPLDKNKLKAVLLSIF